MIYAFFILLSWTINALLLKGENRPWKSRVKTAAAILEGICLFGLAVVIENPHLGSSVLSPQFFPLFKGGVLPFLEKAALMGVPETAALFGVLFFAHWPLKDAFLNFFQLKIRQWPRVILYGGNNKGDFSSKYLWKFFNLFEGRNWFVEHWYVSDEFVREHQRSFDRFQFTIKLVCLFIAAAIFATIKIVNEGLL